MLNHNGGPTKLPAKGGGQQQRPGKEEPLVGWRKEGATDLKPLAKQEGGEEEERRFGYPGNSYPQGNSPGRELPGSRANSQNKSVQTDFNGG